MIFMLWFNFKLAHNAVGCSRASVKVAVKLWLNLGRLHMYIIIWSNEPFLSNKKERPTSKKKKNVLLRVSVEW